MRPGAVLYDDCGLGFPTGSNTPLGPDTLLAMVTQIADAGFPHVELVGDLLYARPRVLTGRAVDGLRALAETRGLSYSIHLQCSYGVNIDSPDERIRRAAVRSTIEVIRLLRPLHIRFLVLHVLWSEAHAHRITLEPGLSATAQGKALDRLAEQTAKSLRELVQEAPSRDLCLENVFVDYERVYALVKEFDTSVCFDGGHWHLMGHRATEFVQAYGPRVATIHCHDVKNGYDHQPLDEPLTVDWRGALAGLQALGFAGPVVLEFRGRDASLRSLNALQRLISAVGREAQSKP